MSLTYQQIWEQYSQVEFKRRLYVKRLQQDGTYEDDFIEITEGMLPQGSVNRISKSLPNASYQFGKVQVSNASLKILSAYQEFSSENDPNSIFAGYIRHWSIVKVVDALIDKYSTPESPEEISVTTFQGLIDSTTATTEQGYETVTALDFLTVLDSINVKELTLAQTTMNALVYEIMNRAEFTKYFYVSDSTAYIDAGYNATNIDVSVYEDSVLDMLEDLAKGHSVFYINPTDNYFYFKEASPTVTVQYSFLEQNNRKISISKYREGVDRQINKWFWEDTDISAVQSPEPITLRAESFKIEGITNTTQRQNLLDFVLSKTEYAKPYFQLEIPYFPIIKLLDRIKIQSFGQAPVWAARWGMFLWTSKNTTNPSEAPRWHKPAGIRISADEVWMVIGIIHDANLKTILEVEKILIETEGAAPM
jgi:hypothetical protein